MTISHENTTLQSNDRRLRVLNELKLLKTDHTESFDRLTRVASTMLDAPISLATVVADDYQYFVGMTGITDDPYVTTRSTPLTHSFCQYVVASGEPLVIQDAREDDLVKNNLAIPELDVIGYLGIPIKTSTGDILGSFCVITHDPRDWTTKDIDLLTELTDIVIQNVEHLIDVRARHLAELEREQYKALRHISHQMASALLAPITSIQMKITLLERTTHDSNIRARLNQTQQHLDTVRYHLREFMEIASTTNDSHTTVDAKPLIRSAVYALASQTEEAHNTALPNLELEATNHTVQANAKLLRFALRTLLTHISSYDKDIDLITVRSQNRDDTLEVNLMFPSTLRLPTSQKETTVTAEVDQFELILIQQVVKSLPGRFAVKTQQDVGTVFSIQLPLAS